MNTETAIASPNGAARRAERIANEAATEQLYQRVLHDAGCRVVATATGWVAVSPAFLALCRKGARQ